MESSSTERGVGSRVVRMEREKTSEDAITVKESKTVLHDNLVFAIISVALTIAIFGYIASHKNITVINLVNFNIFNDVIRFIRIFD